MTGEELRRIAIVGGGIASLTAAETLRREGFDGDLTIIGDEPHAPYSRPALSKAALLDDEMTSHRLPDPEHGAHVVRVRFADAQEIGGVIAFLCTDAAAYVNGQSIAVDGGRMQSI